MNEIINMFLKVVRDNYVNFNGRARRKEYWMFFLCCLVIGAVAGIIDAILGTKGIIGGLVSLALLLPNLAVIVRRLHDLGKGGGWIFIAFIPVIGGIWLLILMATDSQPGENRFGPNPKGVPAA